MRFFWCLGVISVLIPTALLAWAIVATQSSDATGGALTTGFALILGVCIDGAIWLTVLAAWIVRIYRRDSAVKIVDLS